MESAKRFATAPPTSSVGRRRWRHESDKGRYKRCKNLSTLTKSMSWNGKWPSRRPEITGKPPALPRLSPMETSAKSWAEEIRGLSAESMSPTDHVPNRTSMIASKISVSVGDAAQGPEASALRFLPARADGGHRAGAGRRGPVGTIGSRRTPPHACHSAPTFNPK